MPNERLCNALWIFIIMPRAHGHNSIYATIIFIPTCFVNHQLMIIPYNTPTLANRLDRVWVMWWSMTLITYHVWTVWYAWRMEPYDTRLERVSRQRRDLWRHLQTGLLRLACMGVAVAGDWILQSCELVLQSRSCWLCDFILLTGKLYHFRIFSWLLISLWINVYGLFIYTIIYNGQLTRSGVTTWLYFMR